jgi:hypothetical protein
MDRLSPENFWPSELKHPRPLIFDSRIILGSLGVPEGLEKSDDAQYRHEFLRAQRLTSGLREIDDCWDAAAPMLRSIGVRLREVVGGGGGGDPSARQTFLNHARSIGLESGVESTGRPQKISGTVTIKKPQLQQDVGVDGVFAERPLQEELHEQGDNIDRRTNFDEESIHSYIPDSDATEVVYVVSKHLIEEQALTARGVLGLLDILERPKAKLSPDIDGPTVLYARLLSYALLDEQLQGNLGLFTETGGIQINVAAVLELGLGLWRERFDTERARALFCLVIAHEAFHCTVFRQFSKATLYQKYRGKLHYCSADHWKCYRCALKVPAFKEQSPRVTSRVGDCGNQSDPFYGYPLEEALATAFAYQAVSRFGFPPSIVEELEQKVYPPNHRLPFGYSEWRVTRFGSLNWKLCMIEFDAMLNGYESRLPVNYVHDLLLREHFGTNDECESRIVANLLQPSPNSEPIRSQYVLAEAQLFQGLDHPITINLSDIGIPSEFRRLCPLIDADFSSLEEAPWLDFMVW